MVVSKSEQLVKKSVKKLLFADADQYAIPAVQGWNEGYSKANKFLYIQDTPSNTTSRIKINHS